MGNERKVEMELDLQKLLQAYLRKWWIILSCAIVVAVLMWYYSVNFITPLYQAKVTVYVNNVRRDQQVESVTTTQIAASQRLVNTYINIIKSDTVMEDVAVKSGLNMTANQIRGVMTATQVDDTELFDVIITHKSPKTAAQIANAIAEVAPGKIEAIVEGSSTKIIDYAKVPTAPSSPNIRNNCLIGALAGCIIALLYVMLRFLLDVRIKGEEDLTSLFDVPVLAQIPSFINDNSKRRNGYSRDKYGYHSNTESESKGAR